MPSLWFRVTSLVFVDEWVGFGIKKVTKVSCLAGVVSPLLTLQTSHVRAPTSHKLCPGATSWPVKSPQSIVRTSGMAFDCLSWIVGMISH